jgi:hypothetical protein
MLFVSGDALILTLESLARKLQFFLRNEPEDVVSSPRHDHGTAVAGTTLDLRCRAGFNLAVVTLI